MVATMTVMIPQRKIPIMPPMMPTMTRKRPMLTTAAYSDDDKDGAQARGAVAVVAADADDDGVGDSFRRC